MSYTVPKAVPAGSAHHWELSDKKCTILRVVPPGVLYMVVVHSANIPLILYSDMHPIVTSQHCTSTSDVHSLEVQLCTPPFSVHLLEVQLSVL